MRENPLDNILDKVLKRQTAVSDKITFFFKKTRPFASTDLSPQAKIWATDNLGTEDMSDLINEFGQDRVGYMLYQLSKSRSK